MLRHTGLVYTLAERAIKEVNCRERQRPEYVKGIGLIVMYGSCAEVKKRREGEEGYIERQRDSKNYGLRPTRCI